MDCCAKFCCFERQVFWSIDWLIHLHEFWLFQVITSAAGRLIDQLIDWFAWFFVLCMRHFIDWLIYNFARSYSLKYWRWLIAWFICYRWPEEKMEFDMDWFADFMARHPKIADRVTHTVSRPKASKETAAVAQERNKLELLQTEGYFDDPGRLSNQNENAFTMAELWKERWRKRARKS